MLLKEEFVVKMGLKGQKGFPSGYHRKMRVVMLIKMELFALLALLLHVSFWHNLRASR